MGTTHVTFTTLARVYLSWLVSPASLHTARNLSSINVITPCNSERADMLGWCHVILLRWLTGAGHHLAVVSAHAEWTTHVQTPVVAVIVMRMTMFGVKTAVFSLTRQSFQWNSSGLETLSMKMRRDTTLWKSLSVMVLHTLTCLSHSHTLVDFIVFNVLIIQQKLKERPLSCLCV